MKQARKKRNPKKQIAMLLVCCMLFTLLPTTALASEPPTTTTTEKNITLGISALSGYDSTNGYEHIYYGVWNNSPIKWRILDTKTNMENAVEGDGLFLLSDVLFGTGVLGEVYFQQSFHIKDGTFYKGSSHSDGDHTNCGKMNAWQGSDAQSRCNSFYNTNLTTQEQNAILATTKSDNAITYGSENTPFSASENILNNDKIFFLSVEEAVNPDYGFTNDNARIAKYGNTASMWWLRSSYANNTGSTGYVSQSGDVNASPAHSDWAARLAFNLNSSSVLFTSPAVDGKNVNAGLTAPTEYTGNEYKLTLLDTERKFALTNTTAMTVAGGTVEIGYKNAKTDETEYISAMILDGNGTLLYYGQLQKSEKASGTAELIVPSALAEGTYTVKVFNEQINGDKKTDFASAFAELTLTVEKEKTVTLGASAIANGDTTNAKWDYVYFGEYENTPIKWRVLSKNGNTTTATNAENGPVTDTATYKTVGDAEYTGKALFMLSENTLFNTRFCGTTNDNVWQTSNLRSQMQNNIFGSTSNELKYVLKTTKTDTSETINYIDSYNKPYSREWAESTLSNDTLFALSAREAEQYLGSGEKYANRKSGDAAWWWLRSPHADSTDSVGVVRIDGDVFYSNVSNSFIAARPALNLNLSSVLFTTAVTATPLDTTKGLVKIENYEGNEYKLTLLDSERANFKLKNDVIFAVLGDGTATFSYEGAKTGDNEHISAMILDGNGTVLYYGQVGAVGNSASGSVTFNVPDSLAAGDYTVKIFNEQVNGAKESNFASELKTATLRVLLRSETQVTTTSAITYGDSLILTATVGVSNARTTTPDMIDFYVGEDETAELLGTAKVTYNNANKDSGTATLEVDTTDKQLTIGGNTIIADYGGSISLNGSESDSITVTLKQKEVGLTWSGYENLVYDGKAKCVTASAIGFIDGDNVSITVTDGDKVDAGTYTARAALTGTDAKYYQLPTNHTKNYTITKVSSGSAVATYTVKFDTNGGNTIKNQTVTEYQKAKEPTAPTKDGYTFAGWYTDKELTKAYDFSAKVTKNMTLYAKWIANSIDIWQNPFTDVQESDWFYNAVQYAHQNKLFAGMSTTEFAPNMPMSRGMLVTVLYRLAGSPAVEGDMPFGDVNADAYYKNAILWAVQNNIVSGIGDNLFAPDANITREQLAAILKRYAQYKDYDTTQGGMQIREYNDYDNISGYALNAMTWAVNSGLLKGKGENTIAPQDSATRAEVAAILQRFIEGNK